MTLSALLVCVDKAADEVLQRVLRELAIGVESCPDFARATIRLAQNRFDVLIIDGESNNEVMALLRETRLSRMNDSTLAVAVVSGQESIREMFSLGVNFVVYKPVAYERALSSLRAARAVMRKEKRKSLRATVHAHATVDYANVQQEKATLVDLAQDGMAMLFGKKLPPTSKVYFQFKLPGQSATVRLSGQVVWQDWNGRGGVQFVDVPKASRKLLSEFLEANLPREVSLDSAKEQLPEVTMEIDESQLAGVSVAIERPVSEPPASRQIDVRQGARQEVRQDVRQEVRHDQRREARIELRPTELPPIEVKIHTEPTDEGLNDFHQVAQTSTQPDANNRRAQARYSCRVGAEVFRTGTSVPNHCCLTDLSAGGCYLEVSLPFPQKSGVEIVVRTHGMKLHLRGVVQASHPGYGMGIAFELKTKEEQHNVKKLLDFVAATTEPS
jgi:CheY-like chemotaxis protein